LNREAVAAVGRVVVKNENGGSVLTAVTGASYKNMSKVTERRRDDVVWSRASTYLELETITLRPVLNAFSWLQ
jgi:hypothetical protein